jgi:hypothetical protein
MQKKPIPTIGEKYHFFDDGKISMSRHSIATVTDIITPEQAKDVVIKKIEWNGTEEYIDEITLYDIWISEIDDHRQHEHFKVLNAPSTEVGKPWLYAEETDYFIKCVIPEYDTNDIWFVRTVNGGWFSMNTVTTWMSGELDVTGEIYEKLKKFYKEEYGEEYD